MTLNTFSSGVNTSFSSELNTNFIGSAYLLVDTSTDLDVEAGDGSVNSDTSTKVYSFTSDELVGDYLEIEFLGSFFASAESGSSTARSASVSLALEITSPSSNTLFDGSVVSCGTNGDTQEINVKDNSFKYVHILSANEKSSGVVLSVTSSASTTDVSGSFNNAYYTNRQILFKGGIGVS